MAFRSLRHTLVALLMLLSLSTEALAAVQVRVMPTTSSAAVGSTVTVTVEADAVTDLGGFQFGFSYIAADLQVVSRAVNSSFDQVITQNFDNASGSGMVAASVFNNPPLTGTSVSLATIVFKLLTPVTGNIALANVILGQIGGTELASTATGASVSGYNSYTVSFNSNGGNAVGNQVVSYNGSATPPSIPAKTGSTFAGWYSDSGLSTLFNFSTPITADTVLYAKWTISDITGPTLTVSTITDGAVTNNATLNISGTVFDTSGILDLKVNSIPVNVTGSSFSYAVNLQPGANIITIVATDTLGNATTDSRTIVLDVTAPVLTVSAPADNSKTAQSLTTVSGTISETSTVAVALNSGTPQSASISGTDYTTSVNLGAGLNTISIVATDVAGNSSSAVRSVTYINTTPSLAITTPNQDSTTAQNSLTVSGTVTDLLSTVSLKISMNGQTLTPLVINGTFSQLLTFPSEGTWPIVATATDEVGNSSTVTRTVIYAAPHDGVCGISSGQTLSVAPAVDLCSSGTASSVTGAGPWSWTCGGINGGATISCGAGIVAPVDTIAPVITDFNLPTTAVTLTIPVSIFTATDAVGVTGYLITESATAPVKTEIGWTTTPPATITLHTWGYHKLYAYAKDAADNISASRSVSLQIGPADADGVVVPAVSGAPPAVEPQLTDALKSLNFAMKIEIPTPVEILHGDVAPLINGVPHP
ncbi:MAG TPA: hypothetical protein HPP94_02770, partial [Desulfuromonadales bacterium]|nr:hypothetical protein [Desulfuromonadales bacterium]